MQRYVLIESRDPFEARDTDYFYRLASRLATGGNEVTLFLVQNGVLAARKAAPDRSLAMACGSGVRVLADSLSLLERAIGEAERHPEVTPSTIGELVHQMMDGGGAKVLWH